MRRPELVFVVASIGLALVVVRAPGDTPKPENPAHKELRAVRDEIIKAVNENDRDKILRRLHPNVVVTWMDGRVSHSPQEVKDYYDEMMTGPNSKVQSVKIEPVVERLSDLYGANGPIAANDVTTPATIAIAYGHSNDTFQLRHGLKFDVTSRWTATLVKDPEGEWRIISFQASAPLFDNPLLIKARQMMYLAGGVGAVVGVLLGFLIGRFSMRRGAPPMPMPPPPTLSRPFP